MYIVLVVTLAFQRSHTYVNIKVHLSHCPPSKMYLSEKLTTSSFYFHSTRGEMTDSMDLYIVGFAPIYRCLDFCYSKVNESVCTCEYMAGLILN